MARPVYTCRICGSTVDTALYRADRLEQMVTGRLCHDCVMWKRIIENQESDGHKIIGGEYIRFSENPHWDPAVTKAQKYFVLNNDLTSEVCFNPVRIGVVPPQFRHMFPDTARLVSRRVFRKTATHSRFQCMRKGCYDRYQCLWYNKEVMESGGAWNSIPKNYQPGWEECPLFIDKNKI